MKLYALSNQAARDPAHADLAALNALLTSAAAKTYDSVYEGLAAAGVAYRGQPADPRVRVVTVTSHGAVLSSCGLASKSNPEVEYYVKTGRFVSAVKRSVPPPYLDTIFMVRSGGDWKLNALTVDSSRTCAKS